MLNQIRSKFSKIYLVLGLVLFTSCSHYSTHSLGNTEGSLVYNLLGTKAAFLEQHQFDHKLITEYEDLVHVEKIVALTVSEYKVWLDTTAKHFAEREKPDSLYRYIGRDLFFKASILEKYGHLEKAEGLFSLLFQHFGVTEEALVHHAVLVLKLGELEKARISLLKAVDLLEDSDRKVDLIQVWLNISEALGKQQILTADYNLAMKLTKSHPSVCARYGKMLNEKKQDKEALAILNKCFNTNLSLADKQPISLELAKIYVQKLKFDEAITILEKYKNQKNVEADIVLLLGLLFEQLGKSTKQIDVFNAYMIDGGVDNRILERLADYYFEKNELNKGLVPLRILSDAHPNNVNYKYRLAVANLQMGQFQQTVNLLMELKNMGGNTAQIGLYLFRAYNGLQQYDKALTHLRLFEADEAIQLEALMLAGDYFTQKIRDSRSDEAVATLTQWNEYLTGFSKVKNTVEWTLQYAMTLEAKNEISSAISLLEKSRETLDFQEFQLYYLASLYESAKSYEKTDALIGEILSKNPNFAHAWNFLGYIQLERPNGDLVIAKKSILRAIDLDPKSPHFRDSLGWFYYKSGMMDQALKELQIAHTLDGNDLTIAKHLVQVLVSLKQVDQAKEMLKRLSQNFPAEDFKDLKTQINVNVDRVPASE